MKKYFDKNKGIIIALTVIGCWMLGLWVLFFYRPNIIFYLILLPIQTHLFTGIFITAHDAMHGTVSKNKLINSFIGSICTIFYAMFSYNKMYTKHHEHHKFVHTENDPDYSDGNFFQWYYRFMKNYITWRQILGMAILFNILKIYIPGEDLMLYWISPAVLSTFQLFYFGTWLPHHGEHENIHQARSLKKNHFVAFITCYFFGYHYEHHDRPGIPWWQLYKVK